MAEGKRRIDGVILCEGKYDKIKITSLFDVTVVEVGGFRIYKDKEKQRLIRTLANSHDMYIFMDNDKAGFQLRGYLKNLLQGKKVTHIYTPDVYGKEKRKPSPSKEGKLGVEGIEKELLMACVLQGVGTGGQRAFKTQLVPKDLYGLGLSGEAGSSQLRRAVLQQLGLPQNLSNKGLLEVMNLLYSKEESILQLQSCIKGVKDV